MELYNLLSGPGLDFHVIALDYRGWFTAPAVTPCWKPLGPGFGDSDGWPSQAGVIADVRAVIRYVRGVAGPVPLFLWGHSLGTASLPLPLPHSDFALLLTSPSWAQDRDDDGRGDGARGPGGRGPQRLRPRVPLRQLCQRHQGLPSLLGSPPFQPGQVKQRHRSPSSQPYSRVLPEWLFEAIFIAPMRRRGIHFDTDKAIRAATVPLLILMAQDDDIVPFQLAINLRLSRLSPVMECVPQGRNG